MTAVESDHFVEARAVADAVLYEGYVLYPYRASSLKNHSRWQFGVLMPRAYCQLDGSEHWSARTECLIAPEAVSTLAVRIRFLQLQRRTVAPSRREDGDESTGHGVSVDRLEVDGTTYAEWDEAVDRTVDMAGLSTASSHSA